MRPVTHLPTCATETAGAGGLKIAETFPEGRGSPHGCGLRAQAATAISASEDGVSRAVTAAHCVLDLLEEVVAFIIDEDKRRKIFHFDFPDSFPSPQFRIGHALECDALLGRNHCRRAADASRSEAAVFMAGIGHRGCSCLSPASPCSSCMGTALNQRKVHAAGSGWAEGRA